jgi:hypothetical protein
VDRIEIKNNAQLNGDGAMTNTIAMSIADLPQQLGRIERRGDEVFVDTGNQEFYLNQKKVIGRQKLALGDRIRFAENSDEICLIRVNDG